MWMLGVLFVALVLGLSRLGERRARFLVVPLVLVVMGYQTVKFSLL